MNRIFRTLRSSSRISAGFALSLIIPAHGAQAVPTNTTVEKSAGLGANSAPSTTAPAASANTTVPPIPTSDTASQITTTQSDKQLPVINPPALGLDLVSGGIKPADLPISPSAADKTVSNTSPNTGSNAGGTAPNSLLTKSASSSTTTSNQANANAQADAAAATPSNQQVVPNGAALPSQLIPVGQSDTSPWPGYAAGGFLILGLAATGVMLVRLRQGKAFGLNKSEKQMQLLSTLSLSPKRQIILVRIKDKEVAMASTEHGITLLTELPASHKNSLSLLDDGGSEEPRRRKVQQRTVTDEPTKLVASSSSTEEAGHETAIARSEMLMGALKNLREKNMRGRPTATTTESKLSTTIAPAPQELSAAEKRVMENMNESRGKGEPTMKQTRAAFPKYLANAFEQESKRPLNQSQPSQNSSNGDEAGNVTSMIRERLKDLRPLS
ncbi:hypothetical protein EBU99_02720 [bacterium]|nr:hypothetical protein [bacterium]